MSVNFQTVLSFFGIVTGAIAVVLFLQAGLFSSPLTTTVFIITFGVGVLGVTIRTGQRVMEIVGIILFAVTVVAGLIYAVISFTSGVLSLALVFAALSTGFLIAAYASTLEGDILTEKRVFITLGILAVILCLLIVADVTAGEVDYELAIDDNITYIDNDEYQVGTLSVENPGYIPQNTEVQRYSACLTGYDEHELDEDDIRFAADHIPIHTSQDSSDIVFREDEESVMLRSTYVQNLEEETDIELDGASIEYAESCPSDTDELTLTIFGDDI